jgi:mannose-1-phosphate guanylyltransferase
MEKCIISEHSYLEGSIVGWKAKVGKWTRIEGLSILGEEVVVSDEIILNATIVLPHVGVKSSQTNQGTIILF